MSERLTTDGRLWRVIIASALAMFLVNLDFFAVQVALPDMAKDLNTDEANLQWVISGYMLSLAAFLIVAGRLADLLGRKTWLIIGTSIFGVTSLVGGFATTAEMIIIMRILQGVGAAILMPVCLAVVTNAFPAAKVQRAIGMVFGIAAIGQAGGPLLGGLLTELASWRWVLWVNVPVSVLVIYLAVTSVRQSVAEGEEKRIDWLGLVLVVTAIGVFTFGIDEAANWGWDSPLTWSFILGGLIVGAFFLLWESRFRPPLMDLALFRIREFSVMIGAGMAGNMAAVVTIFLSMIYLQSVEGFTPFQAGLAFLIFSGGITISAQVAGVHLVEGDGDRLGDGRARRDRHGFAHRIDRLVLVRLTLCRPWPRYGMDLHQRGDAISRSQGEGGSSIGDCLDCIDWHGWCSYRRRVLADHHWNQCRWSSRRCH